MGSQDPGFDEQLRNLIKESNSAKHHSHCPYSRFPVGAALLTDDGHIFSGCNVENAVFPLGTCAERVAICKAVSEGYQNFKVMVISSNQEEFIVPCGSCRQNMAEFGMDWDVYMTKPSGDYKKLSLKELLPYGFTPKDLNGYQSKHPSKMAPPSNECAHHGGATNK